MGVRGLKTFIESNDDLLNRRHQLHDTCAIVDACNLIGTLNKQSQSSSEKRGHHSGSHLIQFARLVKTLFGNLETCNIKPILVFDNAQAKAWSRFKKHERLKEAAQEFSDILSIGEMCQLSVEDEKGDTKRTVNHVFKSFAFDNELTIVQCTRQADAVIAKLSNLLKCPVISNDSDFYLMDLPSGVIPIDLIDYKQVRRSLGAENNHHHIQCSIFKQDCFVEFFPNLDKRNLPLLGVLAGNDTIPAKKFDKLCSQLPSRLILENSGLSSKQFRKNLTKQHEKIIKILYFLCSKTLEEAINQLCKNVPKTERKLLKETIKNLLTIYEVSQKYELPDSLSGFQQNNK